MGYDNMGDAWVSAITKYVNPNGDLTYIPTILKLQIPSAKKNEIIITFSKPVSDVSAVLSSNYIVMGLRGRITVNNIILNEGKRVVKMFTSSLNNFQGGDLSITIKGMITWAECLSQSKNYNK